MSACKKHLFFCKFETTLVYVVLGQPEQHSKTLSQKRKEKPIWKYQYCNISEIIFLYLFKVRVKIFHSYFAISLWVGGLCHRDYVEIREQLHGIGSLHPPLGGFQELISGSQAFVAKAFTCIVFLAALKSDILGVNLKTWEMVPLFPKFSVAPKQNVLETPALGQQFSGSDGI